MTTRTIMKKPTVGRKHISLAFKQVTVHCKACLLFNLTTYMVSSNPPHTTFKGECSA